ncbi:MAG: thioredoxin family protein [Planctomycetales bacterium]|nr:thioredoxin family protein [Planctomycetales bacterium]
MDWNEIFENHGIGYGDFLAQYASDAEMGLWRQMEAAIELTGPQLELLGSWTREIRVLCMAGAWCGDCIQQIPIFERFAASCPGLRIRYVDRDGGPWKESLTICGGARVPQVLFLNEEGEFVARHGDRTLSKYRQMSREQLGGTCPTGIGLPPAELTAAVIQDWLEEFERVHWILRLSPRLRSKHGD